MLWITGAKGLLGSALKECAPNAVGTGHEVNIADLKGVRDFVKKNPQIGHIVNCAAFNQVDAAEERREEAIQTNVIGPENLAVVARDIGAKFIHISTDYVFPGNGKRPLSEEDPVGPCNFYGQSKWEGEQRALALGATVVRTSWIFGKGGKTFVGKLLQMLQTQKEIHLTCDQWGRFTYAPDLARALLQMWDRPGLYHYANEGVASKYDFGLAMREEAIRLGYPVAAESLLPVSGSFFQSPCKRPAYSAFDTTKMGAFVAIRPWREALREYLCVQMPVYS